MQEFNSCCSKSSCVLYVKNKIDGVNVRYCYH